MPPPPTHPTAPPAQVILTPDDFAGVSVRQENVLVPTLALVRALGVDAGLAAAAWGLTLVHVCNTKALSNHTIIYIDALSAHTTHILNTIFYAHVKHSPTKTIYIKYYMEKKTKMKMR